MDAYTRILKPTGTPYLNVNTQGKEQYDQSTILYDQSTVLYDSVNNAAYTQVAKPSGTPYINVIKPTS